MKCCTPEFLFKKIVDQGPHSIIITSGTLSPMSMLEAEMGFPFHIKISCSHVI